MNRVICALRNFMQSSPLRGEDGWVAPRSVMALVAVLGLVGLGVAAQNKVAPASIAATPSHSTTIALTSDEQRLVVVNREADSVSMLRGNDNNNNHVHNNIA